MGQKAQEIAERLQLLVAKTYWPSESDYPLEVRLFESPLAWAKFWMAFSQDRPVESVALDYLFRNTQDPALLHLQQQLKEEASDIEVFRVGEVQIDILIKGRIGGQILLVQTKAIET